MPDALSLCMVVKNEVRNLPRCLDSARDHAEAQSFLQLVDERERASG
jgi:hypothetical protein